MNALVLSAGGMFGAYQAGAWKVLVDIFRPDLIVGASIGAVNGWAIAGGCSPDELTEMWLSLDAAEHYRWKFPAGPFGGVLDSRPIQRTIHRIYDSYAPRAPYAMVLTDLMRLRPRIFRAHEVNWQHLAAGTAIVGIFDQVRIDGTLYSDGGLLSAVPLWAAAELGATRALVIDVLPEPPGIIARTFVSATKILSPFRPPSIESLEILRLSPPRLLGAPLDAIYWKRRNIEEWIRAGELAAGELEHSIRTCFGAE